ncbi:hypothetical protein BK004_04805 [bacterium CG10_46_32]|nr:MAG: hypothetical protein BK004_04805 [bacterium CG10_46_32]PIR55692.1 MAG: hypothetical protein COU73_04845 [Parcubacteria group bacterium CG10_big_fil_rev_8_21_14_0_10_46_32]
MRWINHNLFGENRVMAGGIDLRITMSVPLPMGNNPARAYPMHASDYDPKWNIPLGKQLTLRQPQKLTHAAGKE